MSTPYVPPVQTLLNDAANIYPLPNLNEWAIAAGALAAAVNGTPLPPTATGQQLMNYIKGGLQQLPQGQLSSVAIRQLLTFLAQNSTLTGSVAVTGTLAPGAVTGVNATVNGAEPGDFVEISQDLGFSGLGYAIITGVIGLANTVSIFLYNPPANGTITLTGRTLYIKVTKRTT